jgi:lysophospholipase
MAEGLPELSPRCRIPGAMTIDHVTADDGWPLRRFVMPPEGPPKGQIAFLGGRGDFFEKYLEAIGHWSAQGWGVTGFDWRGQGGSGRLHPDGLCHSTGFARLVADLAGFVARWQAETAGPHVIVGHSMGGHLLLRACAEGRIAADGLVLVSPMIGIRGGPLSPAMLHRLARLGALPPLRMRGLWRGRESPYQGHVTTCTVRNAEKLWWKDQQPDLARGAPTMGWLAAATASIAALDQALAAHPVTMPALVLYAADDAIIDVAAVRRVRPFLPASTYAAIPDAAHELLRERDEPRLDCLHRIDQFLIARSLAKECEAKECVDSVARSTQF